VIIEGFEVPHVHIRLYPLTTARFEIHRGVETSDEDLQAEAEKIKSALNSLVSII
jgi:diadenosine tetraphosphate (Ap4A) HIT family hydrolase